MRCLTSTFHFFFSMKTTALLLKQLQAKEKTLWFSDPFLLSAHLTKTLKSQHKEDQAIDLVKRHVGAANPYVYGTLFRLLANNGSHQKMLDIWLNKEGGKNHMKYLSPMGYTVLLSSTNKLAKMIPKGEYARLKAMFKTSLAIWNQMYDLRESSPADKFKNNDLNDTECLPAEEVEETEQDYKSKILQARKEAEKLEFKLEYQKEMKESLLLHSNAMMNICVETAKVGGYELGLKIFSEIPEPDTKSYTLILRICAEKAEALGSEKEEAYETGMKIWKRMPKDLIDERNFASFLLLCSRLSKKGAEESLAHIKTYFGLPLNHKDVETDPKLEVSTASLTSMLHICSKIRYANLGKLWFKICTIKRSVQQDEGLIEAYISLLLRSSNYKEALEKVDMLKTNRISLGLRICAEGCSESEKYWLNKSQAFYTEACKASITLTSRDLINHLIVLVTAKSFKEAFKLLQNNEYQMISSTRDKAEELLKKKKFGNINSLFINIQGLNYAAIVLKEIGIGGVSTYLLEKRVNDAKETIDLLLKHSKQKKIPEFKLPNKDHDENKIKYAEENKDNEIIKKHEFRGGLLWNDYEKQFNTKKNSKKLKYQNSSNNDV